MKRTPLWVVLAMILVIGWAGSVGAAALPQSTRPSVPKGKPTPTAVVAPTKAPPAEVTATPVEEPTLAPTEEPTEEPSEEPTAEPTVAPTPTTGGDGRDTTSALARLVQNTLPDGLINLRAETYVLNGPLVIDKPLTIVGAGMDETIILSEHGDAVIKVESIFVDVSFSGITFQYQGEDYANVVVVDDAAAEFSDCRFTGGVWSVDDKRGGDGLLLWGSASVGVDNCRFDGNDLHGIEVKEKSDLIVVDSVLTENGEDGIAFFGETSGDVQDSEFFANGLHGIGSQDSPELLITGNNLHDNGELGIRLANQTQAEVRENVVSGNGLHGIGIRDETAAIIADNVANENVQSGIVLFGAALGTVTGNECGFNGLHGIGLEDESQGIVEGNNCYDNGEDGIVFFGTAGGVVRNNEFTGNGLHGIGVSGSGSPTFEDNVCSDNVETGIRLSQTTGAVLQRNTCTGNGLHGIHVRDQAAPVLIDNFVADNTEVGIYFSGEATGASIHTECTRNNWGIYIVDTANPWLEDNDCYDNVEADINDERSPEQAAAAVPPAVSPTSLPPAEATAEPDNTPAPPVLATATPDAATGLTLEIVFADDFDGEDTDFTLVATDDGEVWLEDGELHVFNYTESAYDMWTSSNHAYDDAVIQIDSRHVDGTDDNWHELICRRKDADNYVQAEYSADGYVSAKTVVDGEDTVALEVTQSRIVRQGVDAVNTMRLACVGDTIRYWLNDTLVAEFTEDRLGEGDIAVGVSSLDGDYSEIAFDNFTVAVPVETTDAPVTPEAPATGVPVLEDIIYEDDFSDPDRGWDVYADDSGEVWYEDDELHILNYADSDLATFSTPDLTVNEAVIEVDSYLVDGSAANWIRVGCYVDSDNLYAANYSSDGWYIAGAWVDGEYTRTAELAESDAIRQGVGAVNRTRFVCLEDHVEFWINDVLVVEYPVERALEGTVLLEVIAMEDTGETEVAFDNLVVTAPGPGDTGAGKPPAPEGEVTATVTAQRLNVRDGPGANFAIVTTVRQGDLLPVLGRNADCSWVNVVTDDGEGWVSTGFVTLDADCASLADTTP